MANGLDHPHYKKKKMLYNTNTFYSGKLTWTLKLGHFNIDNRCNSNRNFTMYNLTFIIILNCQVGFTQWINHGKSKNIIKPGGDVQTFIDSVHTK